MQTPQTTKMVSDPGSTLKMVKIKTLRDIRLDPVGTIVKAGNEVEVTEEQAKEFCDLEIEGNYAFAGERANEAADRHRIRRAQRL
jgi:hypothetical protein